MSIANGVINLLESMEEEIWDEIELEEEDITEDTWLVDDSPFNEEEDLEELTKWVVRDGKKVKIQLKRKKKKIPTSKEKAGRRKAAISRKRTMKTSGSKRKRALSQKKRKQSGLKKSSTPKGYKVST